MTNKYIFSFYTKNGQNLIPETEISQKQYNEIITRAKIDANEIIQSVINIFSFDTHADNGKASIIEDNIFKINKEDTTIYIISNNYYNMVVKWVTIF